MIQQEENNWCACLLLRRDRKIDGDVNQQLTAVCFNAAEAHVTVKRRLTMPSPTRRPVHVTASITFFLA